MRVEAGCRSEGANRGTRATSAVVYGKGKTDSA